MKKVYYKIIILLIITISSLIFVYNDYYLYKTPILKVTNIDNRLDEDNIYEEDYYIQNITGKLMNGKYKGKELNVTNSYSKSLVYEEKIEKNNELLVELSNDGDSILSIKGIKRDKYLVLLLVVFIDLIVIIAGKKGIQTIISLAFNVGLTSLAILLYIKNHGKINMLILYLIISMIFIGSSLFITNGKSKKTLAAVVSSIISLLISFGLSFIFIKINEQNIYIWIMDYVEAVPDYYDYLYVSVLLCGLGAIMDIAITISSSLNELIVKNNKIDRKTLIKSGNNISEDVVGTMINVMLFTCYTSIIPTVVLAIRNNIPFANALNYYGNLEFMIILCTCIGIIITIPVSLYTSANILKGSKRGEMSNE